MKAKQMKYMYAKSEWTLKKNKQTHLERIGEKSLSGGKESCVRRQSNVMPTQKDVVTWNSVTILNRRNVSSSSSSSSSMSSVIAHVWDYNILSANIAPLHAKKDEYCSVCLLQTTQPNQLYSQWNLSEKLVQVANSLLPPALLCLIT